MQDIIIVIIRKVIVHFIGLYVCVCARNAHVQLLHVHLPVRCIPKRVALSLMCPSTLQSLPSSCEKRDRGEERERET